MTSLPMFGSTNGNNGIGNLGSLAGNTTSVGHNLQDIAGFSRMAQDLYRSQMQSYNDAIQSGASASNIQKPVMEKAIGSSEEYNRKMNDYLSKLPQQNNLADALKSLQTQATNAGIKNVPAIPDIPKSALYDTNQANQILSDYTKKVNAAGTVEYYNVDSSLAEIQKNFIAAGGKASQLPLPSSYGNTISSESSANSITSAFLAKANGILGKQVQSTQTTEFYDVDTALNQALQSALSAGMPKGSVNLPPAYLKSVTSQADAIKIVNDFTAKLQAALPSVYSPQNSVNQIYQDLVNSGYSNIIKPPQGLSDTNNVQDCQTTVDNYINSLNASNLLGPTTTLWNAYLSGVSPSQLASMAKTAGFVSNVDPGKTGTSVFVIPLDPQNIQKFLTAREMNPSLTEYAWRAQNNEPLYTTSGNYKQLTPQDYSYEGAHDTGNKDALSNPAVRSVVDQQAAIQKVLGSQATASLVSGLSNTTATPKVISGVGLVPSAVVDIAKLTSPESVKILNASKDPVLITDAVNNMMQFSGAQPYGQVIKQINLAQGTATLNQYDDVIKAFEIANPGTYVDKSGNVIQQIQKQGMGNVSGVLDTSQAYGIYTSEQYKKMLDDAFKAATQSKLIQAEDIANPLLAKDGVTVINQIQPGSHSTETGLNSNGSYVLLEKNFGTGKDAHTDYLNAVNTQIDSAMSQASVNKEVQTAFLGKPLPDLTATENDIIKTALARGNAPIIWPNAEDVAKSSETKFNVSVNKYTSPLFEFSANDDKSLKSDLSFSKWQDETTKGISTLDTEFSKYVPSWKSLLDQRDEWLKTAPTPIRNYQSAAQTVLYSNPTIAEGLNHANQAYDWAFAHPASVAIEAGKLYALGVVFDVALGVGLGVAGEGLALPVKGVAGIAGKAAEVADSVEAPMLISKSLNFVTEKTVQLAEATPAITKLVGNGYFLGDLANSGVRSATGYSLGLNGLNYTDEHGIDQMMDYATSLAIGKAGMNKGAGIREDPISIIPGMHTVDVMDVSAHGSDTGVKPIKIGTTFTPLGKSLISYDNADHSISEVFKGEANFEGQKVTLNPRLHTGLPEISDEQIVGKDIKPYSNLGTQSFDNYVENNSNINEIDKILYFAGKDIATSAYNAKVPISNPEKFIVTSENIPDSVKSTVADTIKGYSKGVSGKAIQVYGSVAQGLQMKNYFTRVPHDIEVSVKNPSDFVDSFKTKAKRAGLVSDKDYKISTDSGDVSKPKIYFKDTNGKWQKGIEVFSIQESDMHLSEGYVPEQNLSYDFQAKPSLKVDGTDLMTLQEQAARKLSATAILRNNKIELMNPGRIKDIGDLTEIGTGYSHEKNIGNLDSILEYAKAAKTKYGDKIESPVLNYIAENGELPTKEYIKGLTDQHAKIYDIDGVGISKNATTNLSDTLSDPTVRLASSLNSLPGVDESVMHEMVKPGSTSIIKPIRLGKTMSFGNLPVLSWGENGFNLGASELTSDIVSDKVIQPYSKAETAIYEKYIKNNLSSLDKAFYFAAKGIGEAGYNTRSTVSNPTEFKITSKDIPDSVKQSVQSVVKSYSKDSSNGLVVKGSLTQDLYMHDYMTRQPADMEVYVNDPEDFVTKVTSKLTQDGFKQGSDFNVKNSASGPKIAFNIGNGKWAKGIEIFSNNPDVTAPEGMKIAPHMTYGYDEKPLSEIEGIKLLSMQEQAARKFSGVSSLVNGVIGPSYEGRNKDIGDLIELGTANYQENGIGNLDDILTFSKSSVSRYGDKIKSPVAQFISKEGRLPSKEEITQLKAGTLDTSGNIVLSKEIHNLIYNGIENHQSLDAVFDILKNMGVDTTNLNIDIVNPSEFDSGNNPGFYVAGKTIFDTGGGHEIQIPKGTTAKVLAHEIGHVVTSEGHISDDGYIAHDMWTYKKVVPIGLRDYAYILKTFVKESQTSYEANAEKFANDFEANLNKIYNVRDSGKVSISDSVKLIKSGDVSHGLGYILADTPLTHYTIDEAFKTAAPGELRGMTKDETSENLEDEESIKAFRDSISKEMAKDPDNKAISEMFNIAKKSNTYERTTLRSAEDIAEEKESNVQDRELVYSARGNIDKVFGMVKDTTDVLEKVGKVSLATSGIAKVELDSSQNGLSTDAVGIHSSPADILKALDQSFRVANSFYVNSTPNKLSYPLIPHRSGGNNSPYSGGNKSINSPSPNNSPRQISSPSPGPHSSTIYPYVPSSSTVSNISSPSVISSSSASSSISSMFSVASSGSVSSGYIPKPKKDEPYLQTKSEINSMIRKQTAFIRDTRLIVNSLGSLIY